MNGGRSRLYRAIGQMVSAGLTKTIQGFPGTFEGSTMAKRRKKTPRRKLKDTLNKLVKDHVRERDNHTCQRCEQQVYGTNCHASHVIPVSRDGRLAFDPLNLKILCYHDHINWWHKNPAASGPWFIETFPKRWEYLQARLLEHASLGTIHLAWFEERIAEFQEKGL